MPAVVSVRFSESDFRHLLAIAAANRRTLSQVVRLLLEAAIRENRAVL